MRRCILAGVLASGTLFAAPAQAAVQEVKGRDTLDWDRPSIAIAPGDTVHWTFDGTQQTHNVQPEVGATWMAASPLGTPAAPWEHTFTTEGTYTYFCLVHPTTMRGTVEVTRAPIVPETPPPPPPLSQQPFANDALGALPADKIARDRTKPTLTRVSVRRVARGARVSVRVSEASTVTIKFKRGVKVVLRTETSGNGNQTLTVRDRRLRAGRYRVELRAADVAGNTSRRRTVRLTLGT
ncbi:plastocyanin/azurin family copper-binding protein [Solirubrobacter taibaiensis]|nr:plastocyanin/azurin family copper-binding protein [Solirubrobacter taibaiensis]